MFRKFVYMRCIVINIKKTSLLKTNGTGIEPCGHCKLSYCLLFFASGNSDNIWVISDNLWSNQKAITLTAIKLQFLSFDRSFRADLYITSVFLSWKIKIIHSFAQCSSANSLIERLWEKVGDMHTYIFYNC